MKSITATLGLALAASLALPLSACSNETMLRPAAGATSVGGGSAVTIAHGVQLRANGEAWPGKQDVRSRVTPVHVTVFNDTFHPLEIRYDRFSLVDEYGHTYPVLPPFRMQGGTVASTYGALQPGFGYSGFKLAPAYASLYPGVALARHGPATSEQTYDATYYPHWATVHASPTALMLRMALPEGVLQPGGHVEGYLYFQHVPHNAGGVTMNVQLANASDNHVFGSAAVPFTATR